MVLDNLSRTKNISAVWGQIGEIKGHGDRIFGHNILDLDLGELTRRFLEGDLSVFLQIVKGGSGNNQDRRHPPQTAFEPSLEFLLDIQAHHYTIPNMFLLDSHMVLTCVTV
jgi:hypothetical protein